MTTHTTTGGGVRKPNRLRPFVWGGLGLLLLIPAVAMRFTTEVVWDETDFLVMGTMLAAVGAGYELTVRLSDNLAYRLGAGVAIVTSFLLVWANLAVGFIGNEDNPWNLMFGGVLGILLAGALLSRFQARGLSATLAVTAVAQGLASAIGLAAQQNVPLPPTAVFVGLWLLAAGLFRAATRAKA
jgi:hypothetical protein